MFQKTRNICRRYGAKVGAGAGALMLSGMAAAQEATASETILAKVNEAFSTGELIATAVVLGLFTLFGIKLLWRSK